MSFTSDFFPILNQIHLPPPPAPVTTMNAVFFVNNFRLPIHTKNFPISLISASFAKV